MSTGSPVDQQLQSDQHARSAMLATGIVVAALIAFYFLGGKQALRSAKIAETVRQEQVSDQQRINENHSRVEVVQQELEAVRNSLDSSNSQLLKNEEVRERLTQMEKVLASLPRLTTETRTEIDAATSRKALQNAETIAVNALADKCEQAVLKMRELTVHWDREHAPLLTNDLGRQIASDERATESFATAMLGDYPVVKNSIEILSEFEAAVQPIRKAVNDSVEDYTVHANQRTFFESLLTRVSDANQQLEHRRRAIDAILATTSQNDAGNLTLAQSIENVEKQKALTRVQKATQIREQRLQKTVDDQSEAVLQAQMQRVAAETLLQLEQERVLTNDAVRQTAGLAKGELLAQAKARKIQLEKEFEIEKGEINRLLGTFLGRGRFQPMPNYSLEVPHWQMMDSGPGPFSLGRLASIGALDPTEEGYELLFSIGGNKENDRQKSGFPNYTYRGITNPTVVTKVKRASELLNKYGDLLKTKRLIAP